MQKSFYLFIFTLFALVPQSAYAAKIDTLYLRNGDRIIGEIKSLELGYMTYKTDDVGTLSVKWQRVAHLVSPQYFEVEIYTGRKYYCSIGRTKKVGEIVLIRGGDSTYFNVSDIVGITQLENKFVDKINGSVTIGANYANSTKIGALNSGLSLELRNKTSYHKIGYNITYNQDSTVFNKRQDGAYTYNKYLHKSWFLSLSEAYQQNSELGLVGRLSTEVGVGRSFFHTNYQILNITVGATGAREWSDENTAQTSSEGKLQAYYNRFNVIGNKLDARVSGILYPSFTINNRYRIDINMNISWEIFDDFVLVWTYYYAYDSNPLSESALKEDWGFTTSIGYTL